MKPIFSVITVHCNQLPLLKSTVENVVTQKGFGELIEYIIVDGMSTDGTIDYLHELRFESSVHRIVGRDKGIYDAMNKGIREAKGDYVIFINAGDQFYAADTLFEIHTRFTEFDVLYGDTEISYPNFSRIAKSKPLTKFWQALPFVHQSVLVRRSLLQENLFDLQYTYCADYNQLAMLFSKKVPFVKSDLIISRITAGGASDVNRVAATKEVFRISKNIFSLSAAQKIWFRLRLSKSRVAVMGKKTLPDSAVEKITQKKYK